MVRLSHCTFNRPRRGIHAFRETNTTARRTFVRLPPVKATPGAKARSSPLVSTTEDADFAFILLLESAFFEPIDGLPGHHRDSRSETIDLRISAPSHFVRPHAQHGILVRGLSQRGLPATDLLPLLVGIIRVDLTAALDWLGTATTLTVHSLFPPAFYDYGYRELLSDMQVTPERFLGSNSSNPGVNGRKGLVRKMNIRLV